MRKIYRKQNKKGMVMELIILIIIAFVAVLFFAGYSYGINLVNNELNKLPGESDATNISDISKQTFGYYNSGIDSGLKLISAILIFAYIIATLIIAYYTPEHPIWFILYFLMAILLIIISVYISNAYENLLNEDVIGAKLAEYTIATHFILNLKTYIIIITSFGIILQIGGILSKR